MAVEKYRERVKSEKRAAALAAAGRAFLSHGYDRTTLAHVAREAGISTGTLFKHFPTKAALFEGIMEELWEVDPKLQRPLPPAGNPTAGLTAIGHDYAGKLRQPDTGPLFRVIIAEAPRFPELGQALFLRGKAPYLDRLHAYLRSEIAAGTMDIHDVPLAARQFLGMINDLIFWPTFLAADQVVDDAEVGRVIDEAVLTLLARYGRPVKAGAARPA
ncbi:TetR/AcrR family transcriptional regulator [Nitrospirillum amazonense]|uniref:TetR/AcrR family transcriptional regulator n=1 Tax=Nitrospirillum amazonense TaxID=28077 RepID=UPI002412689E|nr:TetR/AcrR family transcriptional regulator [Nitrospirillum amazonense]MDG3439392.1 TetR/AcrR family transcriptional regulator [Nitrospirillum amazonense]